MTPGPVPLGQGKTKTNTTAEARAGGEAQRTSFAAGEERVVTRRRDSQIPLQSPAKAEAEAEARGLRMTTQAPYAPPEDPRLLPLRRAPQRRLAGAPRSARGSAAAAAGSWAGDPASQFWRKSKRARGAPRGGGWGRVCSPRVLAPRLGPKANTATFSSLTQRPGDSAPSNTSGDAFSSQRPGPQL